MERLNPVVIIVLMVVPSPVAHAAEQLEFAAPPAWVVPRQIPATSAAPADAPVAVLLKDQQIRLGPQSIDEYSETAFKIAKSEGLGAGNVTILWNPAVERVVIHKLVVRRGAEVIDVLASGQRFTTMRRETDLEAATLNGLLTATIHPEDLREGDIVNFSTTISRSDPVLKGHVEAIFAQWNGIPLSSAYARVIAPAGSTVRLAQSDGLPKATFKREGDQQVAAFSAKDVQPLILPGDAPIRFQVGRLAEVSDFRDWGQAAELFRPLFEAASKIPPTGPLRDEIEKIRASSTSQKAKAEAALKLVQNRIRYVALLLGQGSYVPTNADQTWSRRFGDCKAKTVLLIGMLRELGIAADPVLVSTGLGDAIADRLPLISLFDHVIVRAQVDGKAYWLDGTRTGDTSLDEIQVPNFGWVLPMIREAQLVRIQPAPLTQPSDDLQIAIDATAGVFSTAKITATQILRGDPAVAANAVVSAMSAEQRKAFFNQYWQSSIDFATAKVAEGSYDPVRRVYRMTMSGDGKIDWQGRQFWIPKASLAFEPDFKRAAGPAREAPFTLAFPAYRHRTITIRMPKDYFAGRPLSNDAPIHETVAGTEYRRTFTVSGDIATVETSERALMPELPYAAALAAEARLRSLNDNDLALTLPDQYRPSASDVSALDQDKPQSANAYLLRGVIRMNAGKFDQAIADFSEALRERPQDEWLLVNRGVSYAQKKDYPSAERDFAAVARINPKNPALLRGQALIAQEQGDYPKALSAYTQSLELDPKNSFALFHRSRLFRMNSRYDDAIRDLTAILEKSPNNTEALATRAQAFAEKGDEAGSKRDMEAAIKIGPNDPAVVLAKAWFASRSRDSDAELAAYAQMIAQNPEEGHLLVERASTYLRLKRHDEALADADRAIKLGHHPTEVRLIRANIFLFRNDRDAVAREAETMISEEPLSTMAQVAAGKSFAALGLREKAMQAFSAALAIRPEPLIYTNRADVRRFSDLDGRIADLDEALKLDPDDVFAVTAKAYNVMRKGDFDAASKLYDRAAILDVDPENRSVPFGRAQLYFRSGKLEQSRKLLAELRSRSKSANDFNSLCWLEARVGMFLETALDDCRKALTLNEKLSPDGLGIIYLRLGKNAESVAAFDQAITLSDSAFRRYARSIALSRLGRNTDAAADRKAALKLDPDVEDEFAEIGIQLAVN